jgi:hypothetical protein
MLTLMAHQLSPNLLVKTRYEKHAGVLEGEYIARILIATPDTAIAEFHFLRKGSAVYECNNLRLNPSTRHWEDASHNDAPLSIHEITDADQQSVTKYLDLERARQARRRNKARTACLI